MSLREGSFRLSSHHIGGANYEKYFSAYLADYNELLQRLHKDAPYCDAVYFYRLAESATEALYFFLDGERLVSTAQASLCLMYPVSHVFLNNIVTAETHEGRGIGRKLLHFLESDVKRVWGFKTGGNMKLILTNSPKKQNGGFYERCGFVARTEENNNATVVWTKGL
jgi:GNAT superfamily N-acetyltransferase